jgi:tRNA (adenine57-N1/adenine58-N1)-methyltransferase
VLPSLKRRASKTDFSDEDVELWTPGSLGERQSSNKRARKVARQASSQAELAVTAGETPAQGAAESTAEPREHDDPAEAN